MTYSIQDGTKNTKISTKEGDPKVDIPKDFKFVFYFSKLSMSLLQHHYQTVSKNILKCHIYRR